MPRILEKIRERIISGGEDDFELLLRTLDVQVTVTSGHAGIRGMLPGIDRLSGALAEETRSVLIRTDGDPLVLFSFEVSFR